MSKQLKVGDKVAVYVTAGRLVGVVGICATKETNLRVDNISNGPMFGWFHPKQCRRLKPKKELRRVWISTTNANCVLASGSETMGMNVHVWNECPLHIHSIEFIEVRRGK